MSVAGGLPRAVERAIAHGCDALQIFAKNASQWRGRVLPPEEIREFRRRVASAGLPPVLSHGSYLINLATANRGLRRQSIEAMADELDRAEALGLLGVVLHPGCYTDGQPDRGLALIAEALDGLLRARRRGTALVILEHTAGQGTSLGATFEDIRSIIDRMKEHHRIGVCLDTCHLLASGYDITSPEGYTKTFDRFDRLIGFDRLKAFHVNDSKKPLGSRVDRHTHIGEGLVGLESFRRLVNDRRFRGLPMLLETPKSEGKARGAIEVDPLDQKNLSVLRSLIDSSSSAQSLLFIVLGALVVSSSMCARPTAEPIERALALVAAGNAEASGAQANTRANPWGLPDDPLLGFIEIPAGPFLMGDNEDRQPDPHERPQSLIPCGPAQTQGAG